MGFQLVIAEGKEAGREFVFEQSSVLIGRTSECDVVLYDPGVSRKHARIFEDSGKYLVEDMGSSNGTKVNGTIVKKKQLADGDSITLGPVVFNFSGVELAADPSGTDAGDGPGPEDSHTRVVSAADVKRSRNKGVAMVPEGVQREELKEMARRSTRTMQAISKARVPGDLRKSGEQSGSLRRSNPQAQAQALSAAEKARIRREAGGGPFGRFKIWWVEAPPPKRLVAGIGIGAFSAVLLGAMVYAVIPKDDVKPPPPEPMELTAEPVEQSFGVGNDGDATTYNRADQKVFDFELKAPVRPVVVLHYQAKDCSSGEVLISVNGADVGQVPPDTMASSERQIELLIPSNLLVKDKPNKVVFDNTKNPPANEPWRVWNLWVETFLLPELPDEQLREQATQKFKKGQEFFERRDVGAPNRQLAYAAFREAWLMLEAHPEPKPSTYALARDKMKEAQSELDRQCSKLLLGAQSAYNARQFETARIELENISTYFPQGRHPCLGRAAQLRVEWDI